MNVDIVDFIWRTPSGVVIIIMLIYALRSLAKRQEKHGEKKYECNIRH